jgi:hypothetical protein
LLGASNLLSTNHRAAALERLKPLSFDSDPRIAGLARAQVWRTTLAGVNDLQAESWHREIESIPETLRAGPYYVLGRMLAARHQPDRAALAYLRVPILYPRHRQLAARCLLEAGRELERIGQKSEAASLYRELTAAHSNTPAASEGQSRLQALNAQ